MTNAQRLAERVEDLLESLDRPRLGLFILQHGETGVWVGPLGFIRRDETGFTLWRTGKDIDGKCWSLWCGHFANAQDALACAANEDYIRSGMACLP